nr:hypothetical protein [Tanacetum cinerariifolium]
SAAAETLACAATAWNCGLLAKTASIIVMSCADQPLAFVRGTAPNSIETLASTAPPPFTLRLVVEISIRGLVPVTGGRPCDWRSVVKEITTSAIIFFILLGSCEFYAHQAAKYRRVLSIKSTHEYKEHSRFIHDGSGRLAQCQQVTSVSCYYTFPPDDELVFGGPARRPRAATGPRADYPPGAGPVPRPNRGENRRGRASAHTGLQLQPQRRAAAARPLPGQPGTGGPLAAVAAHGAPAAQLPGERGPADRPENQPHQDAPAPRRLGSARHGAARPQRGPRAVGAGVSVRLHRQPGL